MLLTPTITTMSLQFCSCRRWVQLSKRFLSKVTSLTACASESCLRRLKSFDVGKEFKGATRAFRWQQHTSTVNLYKTNDALQTVSTLTLSCISVCLSQRKTKAAQCFLLWLCWTEKWWHHFSAGSSRAPPITKWPGQSAHASHLVLIRQREVKQQQLMCVKVTVCCT